MVQPSFSHPDKGKGKEQADSPLAALDRFLDTQHQSFFEELYQSEAVCLCMLRMVPPVFSQIVLHFLWSYDPIPVPHLKSFLQFDQLIATEKMHAFVKPLLDRKILKPLENRKNQYCWPINPSFKKGLRNALTGLGTSNSFGVPYERGPDDPSPDEDELFDYGEEIWESILKYMVSSGPRRESVRPKREVLQLLYASGLMSDVDVNSERDHGRTPNYDRLKITSKGFQFLLEDRQTQLWQILMFYLSLREERQGGSAEVLSMFFSLSCMQLGQDYSASKSFPRTYQTLVDLEQYGFIYKRQKDAGGRGLSDQFFPTHLATSLCSGELSAGPSSGGNAEDDKRFLILETNYKIYAYTSNELEIAILNLFMDIKIRYPNLVVGKLDRKNVKAAMENGISAHQIISYLQTHAHPQMYNSPPPLLHPTIVDQLHLWDRERNRLQTEESSMFSFFSKDLYDATEAYARQYQGVQLALPDQKILFVIPQIKDAVGQSIKEWKQANIF